jgi:hypothetical protein
LPLGTDAGNDGISLVISTATTTAVPGRRARR